MPKATDTHNTPAGPDAELIRLCDRIVAINTEERAISARYPDRHKSGR